MIARAMAIAAIASAAVLCIGSAAIAGQAGPVAPVGGGSAEVFNTLDADRNGSLTPQEFQRGYAGLRSAIALEVRLREQFQSIDADRDGALDAGEYANLALVKRAGQAAPGLAAFDASKDQKLQFGEYLIAVRTLLAHGRKQEGSAPGPTSVGGGHR